MVLQASYYANGGEIFVLDMGKPVKIYDLAYNMIKLSGYKPGVDIKIEVTGLRPGEKLYEELLIKNPETSKKTANSRIFVEESTFNDLNAIKESFELFDKAIKDNNYEQIRQVLMKYVTTYHPVNAINNPGVKEAWYRRINMKAIVLAAGYATRLYPLTENFPKPLLEVQGKTILEFISISPSWTK